VRIVADRNSPRKWDWCADIVLATADGLGTHASMRRMGTSKPCVWRWQERHIEEGVEGLKRDKKRPPRIKPLAADKRLAITERTPTEKPANATHWSARQMAEAVGVSRRSVQRVWAGAGVKPHLVRTIKISNDPKRARVLCVDEKSQVQALDRTQTGLPIKQTGTAAFSLRLSPGHPTMPARPGHRAARHRVRGQ
jgi:transposase